MLTCGYIGKEKKKGRKRTAKEVGANNSEDAGIVKELGQEALVRN